MWRNLDSVPGFGPGGCGFKSRHARYCNDGSVLAEVPYAGVDTAGFAGGEDPPVRGVYKG